MKKTIKKIIASFLVVAIILCSAPLSGLVGLKLPDWLDFSIESSAAETATSGTCGENLTWNFIESTGTLTISGTGTMKDFEYDEGEYPPWILSYCEKICKVVIEDGVTTICDYAFVECYYLYEINIPDSVISIGDCAFGSCSSLNKIDIPNSVISIGDYAFAGCQSLNKIDIPNSVTAIGDYAFYYCISLNKINIPNSVISIGKYAFKSCENLPSVEIPCSVTTIGVDAFYGCYLLNRITVDKDNQHYSSDEYGVLFNKNKTELIKIPELLVLLSYEIPNSVTTIKTGSCYCAFAQEIIIPTSVLTIEENAIGGLNAIYYKGTEEQWSAVSVDESNDILFGEKLHFNYVSEEPVVSGMCGENLTWKFDEATKTLTISGTGDMNDYSYIDDNPWISHQKDIVNVVVSDGVTSIGECAFAYLLNLRNISIPNSVTTIGGGAFGLCTSLESIEIPNSVTTIDAQTFAYCYNLANVEIPNSVTTIGEMAFAYCYNITSVEIPDSVTTIGEMAFAYCTSLTNVTIGDSVTTIGEGAFTHCTSLTSVTIGDSVTTIGEDAFVLCISLESIVIPNSVTTIGASAFEYCLNLSKVYYDGTAEQWSAITIGKFNSGLYCADIIGDDNSRILPGGTCGESLTWEFDKSTGTLTIFGTGDMDDYYGGSARPWECCRRLIKNIVIEDGVTSVGKDAFSYYDIHSVIIPATITKIGSYAFYHTNNLEKVYFGGTADQWNAITIGSSNSILYSLDILDADGNPISPGGTCGENLTWEFDKSTGTLTISGTGDMENYSSGNSPWTNCRSSIKNVIIEDGVTSIGDYAFYYTNNLEKVHFLGTQDQWNEITIGYSNSSLTNATIHYGESIEFSHYDESHPHYVVYTCSECNDTFVDTTKTKFEEIIDEAVSPNCTETGLTIGSHCSVCGEIIIEQKVVDALEHSYGGWTISQGPTCTKTGIASRMCSVCGDLDNKIIPAIDHAIVIDSAVAPTCTETGLTEGKHCSACDEVIVAQEEIPALGHNYGEWVVESSSTCIRDGKKTQTCSACGDTQMEIITATGHTLGNPVVENSTATTCAQAGSYDEVVYCTVCNEEISRENKTVDAIPHSYDNGTVTTEPTCTAVGVKTFTCLGCENTYTEAIEATGHSPETVIGTAPTCTQTGLTNGSKCSVCGEVLAEQETINALGHTDDNSDGKCDNCEETTCDCNCHKTGITKFFWSIGNFFRKIFGKDKVCACGKAH